MKKILIIFLMVVPFFAIAGADLDLQNQMLDSEIEKLTNERDEKYESLLKCENATKGFKIAGLSTLVATGIGIYGNIKLSQKLKGKNKSNHGGGGLGIPARSADQAKSDDCDEDCPGISGEQCNEYMDCWAKGGPCSCP